MVPLTITGLTGRAAEPTGGRHTDVLTDTDGRESITGRGTGMYKHPTGYGNPYLGGTGLPPRAASGNSG